MKRLFKRSYSLVLCIILAALLSFIVYGPKSGPLSSEGTFLQNPYAYTKLTDKYEELDNIADTLRRVEQDVAMLDQDMRQQAAERDALQSAFGETIKAIQPQKWNLHPPSLLIVLEQKAHELNLDISIAFNEMSNPEPLLETPRFQTVKLPITIEGNYFALTEYITFLDEIDFIDPCAVAITTTSDEGEPKNKGEIMLQILLAEGEGR